MGLSKASPYPLILSLENHCSVEQQTVMARHLKSILGEKLLTKPLADVNPNTLPSPEVSRLWPPVPRHSPQLRLTRDVFAASAGPEV